MIEDSIAGLDDVLRLRDSPAAPPPVDLSHHYSESSKHRVPSKMKEYYKFFRIPGIGNLAGGLPNARFFPYDTLEAQSAKPERWTPSQNRPGADSSSEAITKKLATASLSDSAKPAHIVVPHQGNTSDPTKKIDVTTALQYGTAEGYPPLRSFLRQFTRDVLHPMTPYRGGPEIILSCGNTDGISKTLALFVNPWIEGKDVVRDQPGLLVEKYMYISVLAQASPLGVRPAPVEIDNEGMVPYGPGGLEDVLSNWDDSKGKRPHLLYTVTMGQNPTSGLLSAERRQELYAICSKFDIIIIEDDPYWYLQFPSADTEEAKSRNLPTPEPRPTRRQIPSMAHFASSGYDFIDSLVPSYLSFDTDGRVIRLDTFSKTIAPGCRLGWITAQPEVIERLLLITETSTSQPSGFVQAMVAEIIVGSQEEALAAFNSKSARDKRSFSGWETGGWVRWLSGLRGEYERRMSRMCQIFDEGSFQLKQSTPVKDSDADWGVITKTQLYDFEWPRAGMFVWIHMRFETHPLWKAAGSKGGVIDGTTMSTALLMFLTRKPYTVLVSPGMMFSATDAIREETGWQYYRVCFAAESEENVDGCSLRFTQAVQKFWRIKKVKELEEILKDFNQFDVQDAEGLDNIGAPFGC